MQQNEAISTMKVEAKNLVRMLQADFAKRITHSEALERVAQLREFPNWDTAVACAGKKSDGESPIDPKIQLAQLVAFRAGLQSGSLVLNTLDILAEQSNPVVVNGWRQAKALYTSDKGDFGSCSPSKVLKATGFFGDEVITIMKVYDEWSSDLSAVSHAISYLKMVHFP